MWNRVECREFLERVVILNGVVRKGLMDKVMVEKRSEGREILYMWLPRRGVVLVERSECAWNHMKNLVYVEW